MRNCVPLSGKGLSPGGGVVAYNLVRLFILKALATSWHRNQVQTIRWRLYQIDGKIVFHGEQVLLKARKALCQLFADIRVRIGEFANTHGTSQEGGSLRDS
jgi:hypothetical protein